MLPERLAGWPFEDVRWQPRARSDAESLGWVGAQRTQRGHGGWLLSVPTVSVCVLWRQVMLKNLDGNNDALS